MASLCEIIWRAAVFSHRNKVLKTVPRRDSRTVARQGREFTTIRTSSEKWSIKPVTRDLSRRAYCFNKERRGTLAARCGNPNMLHFF